MRQTRYEFHHQWTGEAGQPYAYRNEFPTPDLARRSHRGSLSFDWASGKSGASVTDLYAVTTDMDETVKRSKLVSSIAIADGQHRDRTQSTLT